MEISLESLGLTVEQMQARLIEAMIDRFLSSTVSDENGDPVIVVSRFREQIQRAIVEQVDATVARLCEPVLSKNIDAYLADYRIQSTNNYGEPKREPETIAEYVTRRGREYLMEGVDYQGLSKEDKKRKGSSTWGDHRDKTTRVAFLIDQRLNDEIETAMKAALADANKAITDGLKSAVIFELNKLTAKMKN